MTIKTVFKVTTKECKSALSLGKRWLPELTTTYAVDQWTVPPVLHWNGMPVTFPLMVFETLDHASRFFHEHPRYNGNWVVWEAEARNAKKRTTVLRVGKGFSLVSIVWFWLKGSRAKIARREQSKYGFMTADAVKLVRMVEPTTDTYNLFNQRACSHSTPFS